MIFQSRWFQSCCNQRVLNLQAGYQAVDWVFGRCWVELHYTVCQCQFWTKLGVCWPNRVLVFCLISISRALDTIFLYKKLKTGILFAVTFGLLSFAYLFSISGTTSFERIFSVAISKWFPHLLGIFLWLGSHCKTNTFYLSLSILHKERC